MPGSVFSCWLIGADSLLEECGDVLLRRGHDVHGVIAGSERVAAWARSRHLTVLDPRADVAAALARSPPFDHLFAITHLSVVPEAILRLPVRGAVNFHDGPLPRYAGLNTPAWAIIQGETRYGITWHAMTKGVDEGRILKSVPFEIDPGETALSLNTKCFVHALESFGELVDALASRSLRPQEQDLGQREYYERHRRPPRAALLDWSRPAAEIDALVRGLEFGRYPNPLGSPKLCHAGRAVLVARSRVRSGDPAGEPAAAPGTLLAVDDQGLLVATGRGSIALTAFTELSGQALQPGALAKRLGLSAGDRLEPPAPELAQRLTELDARMARSERDWVQRLAALDPVTLPLRVDAAPGSRATEIAVPLPPALTASHPGSSLAAVLTAAFGAYLARLSRRHRFDLAFEDEALQRDCEGLTALVSGRVPLRIAIDLDQSLGPLVERLKSELPELSRRGPWLRDAIARHPELQSLREDRDGHLLPVGVACAGRLRTPTLPDGAECVLELDTSAGACRLVYAGDRIAPADAASCAA
ncbi:MAG TPA: formyltransferase family protein, partial [Planctomycetota bacterium]|nr:formyltransferase family protein [Planctomycetota bacterium]